MLFDRSWYTRALTEPTLGYVLSPNTGNLNNVNKWEENLINQGIEIVNFIFH